jgi:hypothetical protein
MKNRRRCRNHAEREDRRQKNLETEKFFCLSFCSSGPQPPMKRTCYQQPAKILVVLRCFRGNERWRIGRVNSPSPRPSPKGEGESSAVGWGSRPSLDTRQQIENRRPRGIRERTFAFRVFRNYPLSGLSGRSVFCDSLRLFAANPFPVFPFLFVCFFRGSLRPVFRPPSYRVFRVLRSHPSGAGGLEKPAQFGYSRVNRRGETMLHSRVPISLRTAKSHKKGRSALEPNAHYERKVVMPCRRTARRSGGRYSRRR